MRYDLTAGAAQPFFIPVLMRAPTILIFDSGVGGLSVHEEVARARPDARFVYVADDAAFPYGALSEDRLRARVIAVMEQMVARFSPDLVVIACNTASTVVLPALRARFSIPFVGTVPAIKPAAAASISRVIAVLATPGTVARDYTRDLIDSFAGDCEVVLVGSTKLAAIAEAHLRGEPVENDAIVAEIAPCFVERRRADGTIAHTDIISLSCTHYPFLRTRIEALAPWPVRFIDPAPAIARRVMQLMGEPRESESPRPISSALFTSGAGLTSRLRDVFSARGFPQIDTDLSVFALN